MTNWSGKLRKELSERARAYAAKHSVPFYESLGQSPITLFPCGEGAADHGNFSRPAITAISVDDGWRRRLDKPHTRRDALPAPHSTSARELDSSTSSDALLMNCFCPPDAVDGEITRLFHVAPGTRPAFGVPGRVALRDGSFDRTEIDMVIGDTHVESKLTEIDFTRKARNVVERYAHFDLVFDVASLLTDAEECLGYQLIRNVLAVGQDPTKRFVVLLDARRPDLLREWWTVYGAIRLDDVRTRCGFVLWQEVAAVAKPDVKLFLSERYGL